MAQEKLAGKRVAALFTDGVEQVELTDPMQALQAAGAIVTIVAPHEGTVRAWNHTDWGQEFKVDLTLDQADPDEFDALLLPGGVMNPDRLRTDERAVRFAREMVRSGKPIAAICHGPWTLVEADAVRGKTMTSWPSLQTDIRNAGGHWVDREVVADSGIVTSRSPKDLQAFDAKMIEEFAEGRHDRVLSEQAEIVEQSSEDSFPASDPPSFTQSAPTPDEREERGRPDQ